MFIFSLLPIVLFLLRFVLSASVPGQNVGLPSDIIAQQLPSIRENLNFIIDSYFRSDWISPYPVLIFFTEILIVSSIVLLLFAWKLGWINNSKKIIEMILCSVLGACLVILLDQENLVLPF